MAENRRLTQEELEQAFSLFNRASAELTEAYHALQQRVEQLTRDLAVANLELRRQLTEKAALSDRLARLLAALPAGVVVADAQDTVVEANPAARRLLGEPLTGTAWGAVAARLRPTRVPHEFSTAGGGEPARRVSLSENPLGEGGGRILLLQDVTEAHALQQQLEHHRRLSAMGEMAAGLAHQLRTPLATALLYASHLGRSSLADADRMRFADKTLQRLRHLEHLVQDMLTFVRAQPAEAEAIPVAALLQELQQVMEPQMAERGVSLQVRDDSGARRLNGSRKALAGALLNLLENALQACSAGGRVALHAAPDGEAGVAITVADDGCGIPEEARERLFEPFFTTRADGTGLGLAIVRSVTEAHGGEVACESAPGAGTAFTVRLPCSAAPAVP